MSGTKFDVVAIGNALMDVLATVSDEFLAAEHAAHGLVKGSMTLVDEHRARQLGAKLDHTINVPGGSAGNTIAGIASFGGRGAYIGKVADDPLGDLFGRELRAIGVDFSTDYLHKGEAGYAPTGHCTILISPDGQRTMNTYLGAAVTLSPEDVDEATVAAGAITYLEGYLFDPEAAKKAFRKAAQLARAAGRRVALTLSDSFCVHRHRDDFRDLVENHVDIVFGNEDELVALEGTDFDAAIASFKERKLIAAITRGSKGSMVIGNGRVVESAAAPVLQVVDTTGAGDQYAAGFLYGLAQGCDLAECARLGGLAAAEVIGHMGPRPEIAYAELLKKAA